MNLRFKAALIRYCFDKNYRKSQKGSCLETFGIILSVVCVPIIIWFGIKFYIKIFSIPFMDNIGQLLMDFHDRIKDNDILYIIVMILGIFFVLSPIYAFGLLLKIVEKLFYFYTKTKNGK